MPPAAERVHRAKPGVTSAVACSAGRRRTPPGRTGPEPNRLTRPRSRAPDAARAAEAAHGVLAAVEPGVGDPRPEALEDRAMGLPGPRRARCATASQHVPVAATASGPSARRTRAGRRAHWTLGTSAGSSARRIAWRRASGLRERAAVACVRRHDGTRRIREAAHAVEPANVRANSTKARRFRTGPSWSPRLSSRSYSCTRFTRAPSCVSFSSKRS
jgi:hypothetical protein